MKKTWIQKNELRLRRTQGCLTDCVAYVLNLHPEKVPYFVYPRAGWLVRLKVFLQRNGYDAWWVSADKVPKTGIHIMCGNSKFWKTYAHVVVYKNGKMVYDPNYPSDWSDSRITHRLVLKKF